MNHIIANFLCIWKLMIYSILITATCTLMLSQLGILNVFKKHEYYHSKIITGQKLPIYFTLEEYLPKPKK